QLHARGELQLGTDFVNESYIGTRFVGRLVGTSTVGGRPAVVPTITGRAWITGTAQYLLDPTDPFPAGFLLCPRPGVRCGGRTSGTASSARSGRRSSPARWSPAGSTPRPRWGRRSGSRPRRCARR